MITYFPIFHHGSMRLSLYLHSLDDKHLCSVWNPENTRKKKNIKENDFFMFGFTLENIKENQI